MPDAPAPTGPDDPLAKLMLGLQNADQGGAAGSPDSAPPAPAPAPAVPPPAPAVPPRLRGQGPAPPPPKPGAPPEDLSLPAVWEGAKKNFARSAAGNIANTAEFLNPMNWGRDAAGLGAVGQGLLSSAGLIDQGDAQAQAAHQAPINAIANMNWEHYGTVDNLLRTLKNDPTTPLSDAAAIASIPLGGEGLVAKVPGIAGDVLRAGMTGAKVAQLGDPTVAALKAAGAGAKIAGAGVRAASKIPGAGLVGEALGMSGGAALGHVLSHAIPIPGAEIIGGSLGDRIAKGAMGLARGNVSIPGPVKNFAGSVVRDLPRAGAAARALPASPEEQQASGAMGQAYGGPGAPGGTGAPGASPALPMDPDEAQAEAMERGFGLRGPETAPGPSAGLRGPETAPGPSAGLQGSPGPASSRLADLATGDKRDQILREIALAESGGRNIPNTHYGPGHTDQGYWQITDQTWKSAAPPEVYAKYQHAMDAPYETQLAVARRLYDQRGTQPWNPSKHTWGPKIAMLATGGRTGFAEGGNVVDMSEALLRRAEAHHKASQQATKPLLGLDDSTVAKALAVAQRAI